MQAEQHCNTYFRCHCGPLCPGPVSRMTLHFVMNNYGNNSSHLILTNCPTYPALQQKIFFFLWLRYCIPSDVISVTNIQSGNNTYHIQCVPSYCSYPAFSPKLGAIWSVIREIYRRSPCYHQSHIVLPLTTSCRGNPGISVRNEDSLDVARSDPRTDPRHPI